MISEDNLRTALLSGIVGILLGGVVRAAVDRYAAFKEAKGIAAAIRAEIEAYLRLHRHAKHGEALIGYIKRLEAMTSAPTHNEFFTFPLNERPFQVFDSLCNRIGLLGDLSAGVVQFYSLGKAYHTNARFLGELRERVMVRQIVVDRAALLKVTRQLADMFEESQAVGREAVTNLVVYQRRRWFLVIP